MTLPTSFNGLISAVKEEFEDDSTEFENYVPTAIQVAEQRLARELDLDDITTNYQANCSIGDRLVSKPSDYRLSFSLFIIQDGVETLVKKRTPDFCRVYWPIVTSVGFPKYYGEYDESNFILAPTPDANYTVRLAYFGIPTLLSSSNQTNYFTEEKCSDILYYATLSAMCEFAKNYSKKEVYETEYNQRRDAYNNEARRRRGANGNMGNPHSQQNNTLVEGKN
jgi:hypothetical protein